LQLNIAITISIVLSSLTKHMQYYPTPSLRQNFNLNGLRALLARPLYFWPPDSFLKYLYRCDGSGTDVAGPATGETGTLGFKVGQTPKQETQSRVYKGTDLLSNGALVQAPSPLVVLFGVPSFDIHHVNRWNLWISTRFSYR
jgi:hypothetical protein